MVKRFSSIVYRSNLYYKFRIAIVSYN